MQTEKIHLGHVINRTLKDAILRSKIIQGFKVDIILGADCHGLPIEKNVHSNLENHKKKCNSIIEFRQECAAYADKFIKIQHNKIKEMFFLHNPKQKYLTKSKVYVTKVIETLFKIYRYGQISKENMPVFYSFEENTNLSFSEIEYDDVQHYAVYFIVNLCNTKFSMLIYTTQIWTILGNEMICINKNIQYVYFDYKGLNLIVSKQFAEENKITNYIEIESLWIVKQKYKINPFCNIEKSIVYDNYVDNSGTGILHCAPAHGYQDYKIFRKHFENKAVNNCIDHYGFLKMSKLRDFSIISKEKNANEIIIQMLDSNNLLYSKNQIIHRYPVSWRSKKPLYIISTDQLIINLTNDNINDIISMVETRQWYGHEGCDVFINMLKQRQTKWCISRQRKWGTPCMFFYNKVTNQICNNNLSNKMIIDFIRQHGEDFWFEEKYLNAIKSKCFSNFQDIQALTYTLDVWFDSGCSSLMINKQAEVILEGRDQHRGWFQTSAIISILLQNNMFAKNIIVHGFVNMAKELKISKSNIDTIIMSDEIMNKHVDIIRIVTLSSDYGKDILFDDKSLQHSTKIQLKFYNLCRYYINMSHCLTKQVHIISDMIDISIINKIDNLYKEYLSAVNAYAFQIAFKLTINTMNVIAEFIRVNKHIMYCTDIQSNEYQSTLTCLKYISKLLYKMLYPIVPTTIIYILTHLEEINDECDVIEYLENNSIKLNEQLNDKIIMKKIDNLFNQINEFIENIKQSKNNLINQNQQIGILIHNREDYLYSYIMRYCQISYIDTLDKYQEYENILLGEINTDFGNCKILNISLLFYKCSRCWRYYKNLNNSMCKLCLYLSERE